MGTADYVYDGVPVIRGQNLGRDRWVGEEFVYVTEEKADSLTSNLAYPGDLIFTQRGTLGQVAIVPRGAFPQYLLSQSQMKVRIDPEKADSLYVYYYCSSEEAQEYLRNHTVQTGVPHINLDTLRKMPIPLPPLSEQRRIAHILGTLDDKIELNRRMNATLEAMARALFRSWFVDFDPVRAKVEGREPAGMDAETATLFPDKFEESEIGEVPKGWRVVPMPEVVEINPRRSLTKGEVAPYLDMQNVPTSGHRPLGWIDRSFTSGTKFINGDTLIARITPCLEHGKTIYVDFLPEGQVGWGSTEFIVIRPKGGIPPEYGYLLARDPEFREYAISNMSGSSGRQRVPSDCFDSYYLVVPPERVWIRFGELVRPSIQGISLRGNENRILAALRDALLPRLLSGDLPTTPNATAEDA